MSHKINLLIICGWYIFGYNCVNYLDYKSNNPEKLKEAFSNVYKSGGYLLHYLNVCTYSISIKKNAFIRQAGLLADFH